MKKLLRPENLPYFTLGVGVIGFLLRILLYTNGRDEKGLFIAGHPAGILLFVLTAVAIIGILLLVLPLHRTPVYKKLFPPALLPFIGCLVAGAGILAVDFFDLMQHSSFDAVATLSFVLGLLAVASLLYVGYCRFLGIHPGFLFRAVVTVYFIVHLISQYRLWSSEPELQAYFFQMMASIFLMLNAYHRATLDAGMGSRRRYAFSNQAAFFFCCLASIGESAVFYLAMAFWCYTEQCSFKRVRRIKSRNVGMFLPMAVRYCIGTLEAAGYEAYVVGGCVRDSLLGLTPKDYDLCTNAKPEVIAELFSNHRLVRSGEKHGTIGVIIDKKCYEITTFRTEGGYADSRHPDWVCFVSDIKEDLARRDFTVNAIAYSQKTGFVDPWNGQEDLKNKVLRTVGKPSTRFGEDPLRILRGMRFAVRFKLTVEAETLAAMLNLVPLMDSLAKERIFDEMCKILPLVTAEDLIRYQPIITQVIPELAPCVNFDQHSPYHAFDVYTHIANVTGNTWEDLPLRWAALLHDVAKPDTFTQDENGRGHFNGHAQAGAEKADKILHRLKAPNALRECAVFLIQHHMIPFEPNKKLLRRRMGRYGVKNCELLLALQRADFCNKGTQSDSTYFDQIEDLMKEIEQEDDCLTTRNLAINGQDLLDMGFPAGPQIGKALTALLDCVQDEIISNTREDLLAAAEKLKE